MFILVMPAAPPPEKESMMNHTRLYLYPTLMIAAMGFSATPSSAALAPRAFVASNGVDTNACSRTAPCRTFGAAIAAVTPGGDVIVLDSAGYGPVTITKSVSLISPNGIYAGITVTSTDNGIKIQNLTLGDIVLLKGLTLNRQGQPDTTVNGISIESSCQLEIGNCTLTGFTQGIVQYAEGINSILHAENTLIQLCSYGIFVSGLTTGSSKAMLQHCTVRNCYGDGFRFEDRTQAVLKDCTAMNMSDTGFRLQALDGTSAEMTLESCVSTFNTNGITVNANPPPNSATLRASNCVITDNDKGYVNAVGTTNVHILSRGNNTIEGNTTNNSFPAAYNPK